MNKPRVWIVILNYNGGKDILECLESLEDISYENYRILLVDNASTDGSLKQIHFYGRQHEQPIEILELPENYGYAGGNNRGIRHAFKQGSDYVLILNPDTIVEKNFLDKLIEVAKNWRKQGKLAFFGSRIYLLTTHYSLRTPKIYSNGGLISWIQTKGTLKDYGKPEGELTETKPFETQYITGTCLLASKETIKKVGFMREDYFLYYEDTDWAIRARKQGIAQVIVPKSIIWHKVSRSTLGGESFSYFERSEKQDSPSFVSEMESSLRTKRGSYIYYHTRNGLYCGWWNGNIVQKIAVLMLSAWTFIKQPIKWAIPAKRAWAKPVMQGVIDFWQGKTGKYEI